MGEISSDIILLIYHLLPGFLAAWIFYGLTAHPKKEAFERVVQALIFTVIVKALNVGVRKLWWQYHNEGQYWTDQTELASSVLIAVVVGAVFAFCANNNLPHRLLNYSEIRRRLCHWPNRFANRVLWEPRLQRFFGDFPVVKRILSSGWLPEGIVLTKRTTFPSEWYSVFHRQPRYVVLHLVKGRRISGWPEEWPDQPDRGHFVLMDVRWLLETGVEIPLPQTDRIVIAVADVKMVEFLRYEGEVPVDSDTVEHQRILFQLWKKEGSDGIESTAAPTETND